MSLNGAGYSLYLFVAGAGDMPAPFYLGFAVDILPMRLLLL